jgi:hypothetical protein
MLLWDTPPYNTARKCQVADPPTGGRYLVYIAVRGRYNAMFNMPDLHYVVGKDFASMNEAKAACEAHHGARS